MSSHDGLLLFKDADVTVDLNVSELLVAEIFERGGHLVLTFMIEEHVECARVVVYFKLCAHRLFYTTQYATDEDDIVDGVAVVLAHVI